MALVNVAPARTAAIASATRRTVKASQLSGANAVELPSYRNDGAKMPRKPSLEPLGDTVALAPYQRPPASSLPYSLAPRGLSRVQAAEYIGLGVTKFDELVADGRMPRPKRIDGRTVWDRMQVDAAFTAIDGTEHNPWDEL